jgi:thiol-disulfide isomerase/thioredoxin
MILRPPKPFHRAVLIACIAFTPGVIVAQSTVNYCEAPAAVKEDLKKVAKLNDQDLPFKVRREQQIAMFRELVNRYPGDFFVQRRYQDARLSGFYVDRNALLTEYRAESEKNPNDVVAAYLYARILIGENTKRAIEISEKLAQQSFPWAHVKLAEIYNYPNFKDATKTKEHLKQWIAGCPEAFDALSQISRSGDKELMTSTAQRLRGRLEPSTNSDDLAYWEDLWTLEFKLKPVTEHALLRQQIAKDLEKIRAANLGSKEWLQTMQAGYKQTGDKTAQRWAEDELIRLLPGSDTARRMVQSRYYDEHPYPQGEPTEGEKQAYYQALADASGEWVQRWPGDEMAWASLVRALTQLEKATNPDVEAAYKSYAAAHERSGGSYSLPPLEVAVSRFYLKRDFKLENIPVMLQKGISEIEQIEKYRGTSDLYPQNDAVESNVKFVRLESWPIMAEAYARLKQPDKARAVLAQLSDIANNKLPEKASDAQKRGAAYNQAVYWQAVGKVAEAEQRKLDALMAYQTALSLRPNAPAANKDELNTNTQRLWKELGGTDQGWNAYLARTEAAKGKVGSAEVATWDTKNALLPEFELSDLDGRKWSLADLKGKVAFINLWATWCGPCRAELPYVQKLREQLKDRKDVVVLTLNIDEEVGMVQPFMKENKYNFPVLLGQTYADGQGVNSIPRNWVVSLDGKIVFEGIGFGNSGEDWMKKATEMIEKVKVGN